MLAGGSRCLAACLFWKEQGKWPQARIILLPPTSHLAVLFIQPCSSEERDMHQTTDLNDARQTYTDVLPNGAVLTVVNVPATADAASPLQLQFSPDVLAHRNLEYTTLPGLPSAVSAEIQRAMQARQLTPADLARKLGVPRSRLNHWLDPDTRTHRIMTLRRIADALDCELIIRFQLHPDDSPPG